MMDAFVLIEEYCQLLVERVVLLQKNKLVSLLDLVAIIVLIVSFLVLDIL